jgi:hypothetical protein
MAFKQATVNASLVAATLTDFPSYIDWSRAGISTLAEAQSSRVYADSGKVVEWAREVVSANEGHTKIPSLTTSTTVYVDYDGIRADYAATDTYGRNAVWSDYEVVFHQDSSTDSAGKHNVTANGGVSLGGVSGQLGVGTDFDGTNDSATHTGSTLGAKGAYAIQFWANPDSVTSRVGMVMNTNGVNTAGEAFGVEMRNTNNGDLLLRQSTSSVAGGSSGLLTPANTMTTGTWQKITATRNSNNARIFRNAVSVANSTTFNTNPTNNLAMFGFGAFGIGAFLYYNGKMDEVRIANFEITANWETTEYNNQNDESSFWGTWTDVGGGPTPANVAARRLIFFGL